MRHPTLVWINQKCRHVQTGVEDAAAALTFSSRICLHHLQIYSLPFHVTGRFQLGSPSGGHGAGPGANYSSLAAASHYLRIIAGESSCATFFFFNSEDSSEQTRIYNKGQMWPLGNTDFSLMMIYSFTAQSCTMGLIWTTQPLNIRSVFFSFLSGTRWLREFLPGLHLHFGFARVFLREFVNTFKLGMFFFFMLPIIIRQHCAN